MAKLWFMPINVFITFIIGSLLGWLVNLVTRPPPHLRGLVIGCCAAGNLGNILIIIVPAVCKEKGSPFGDPTVCSTYGLAYTSLSMAIGAIFLWGYVYNVIRLSIEVSGSSVSECTSITSTAEPESFTEPLLSPKECNTSEDNTDSLPCTRFDGTTQLGFTDKLKQNVINISRNLNVKKLFSPSTNGAGCPKQPGGIECGYVVMRYMKDIVMDSEMSFIKKWAAKNRNLTYTRAELDEVRFETLSHIEYKM